MIIKTITYIATVLGICWIFYALYTYFLDTSHFTPSTATIALQPQSKQETHDLAIAHRSAANIKTSAAIASQLKLSIQAAERTVLNLPTNSENKAPDNNRPQHNQPSD